MSENQLVINNLDEMKNFALRMKDRKNEMDIVKSDVTRALNNLQENIKCDGIEGTLSSLSDGIKTNTDSIGALFDQISDFILQQMTLYEEANAVTKSEVDILRQQLESNMK